MSKAGGKRPLDDLEESGSSSASAKKQTTVKDSSASKKVTPAAQRKERETKVKGANVGELKSFIMDTLLADSEIGSKVALKIDSWSTAAAFKPPPMIKSWRIVFTAVTCILLIANMVII
jgi:hypothetical protein